MRPIIKVENLGKRYRIGLSKEPYSTLRESLAEAVRMPFARLLHRGGNRRDSIIWALKDVGFEIQPGEVIGIIGRNGAGKSTLLKILSRITDPSTGRVELFGRIGSLLEVGTGFHPELTGRENIYLNGAIMGMRRIEIQRKFDEIVEFAEVNKFIDTPVKRYSSGMYVRLAFAVAAHLEMEVLVVDEVLAVGDVAFQKKCLGKMESVGRQGRTVLFVSHSMSSIARLCPRALHLEKGQIVQDGPSHQVISAYLHSGSGTTAMREWPDLENAPGDDTVRLRAVYVRTEDGRVSDAIDIRRSFIIEVHYHVIKPGIPLTPVVRLFNHEGTIVFTSIDTDAKWRSVPRPAGGFISSVQLPGNFLAEGGFTALVSINTFSPTIKRVSERDVVAFQIFDNNEGDSARIDFGGDIPGVVRPLLPWKTVGPV